NNSINVATNAGKFFNIGIPGSQIIVAYMPVDRKAIAGRPFKIIFTPPLGLSRPQQALAAHLVTSYPIERLFLYVRMFSIFYEEVLRCFAKSIAPAYHRIFFCNT